MMGAHWMSRWSVFTAVCCVHTRAVLQDCDCASAVLQTPDAAEARVLASILIIFHVCCVCVCALNGDVSCSSNEASSVGLSKAQRDANADSDLEKKDRLHVPCGTV